MAKARRTLGPVVFPHIGDDPGTKVRQARRLDLAVRRLLHSDQPFGCHSIRLPLFVLRLPRRRNQIRSGQRQEVIYAVIGREEVIQPGLRAARTGWKINQADVSTALFEEGLEARQSRIHVRLGHHVRIEDDVDLPTVQRDVIPLRQCGFPPVLVGPTPVPNAD